jgi:hypothetical protein
MSSQNSTTTDPLDLCAQWLRSISHQDRERLQYTREYHDFLQAASQLDLAHRRLRRVAREVVDVISFADDDGDVRDAAASFLDGTSRISFLQQVASNDVVLRIMDFLQCRDLVGVSRTCARLHILSDRNAHVRTRSLRITQQQQQQRTASNNNSNGDERIGRQLRNRYQLLRAKEQLEGIGIDVQDNYRTVPIPTLLLARRIAVSNCGDPEFDGIYFCTGNNGNGFVFTKPRYPEQQPSFAPKSRTDNNLDSPQPTDEYRPRQPLRCIIAKCFSNEVCGRR